MPVTEFGLEFMGENYYLRFQSAEIESKQVTNYSMNCNEISGEFENHFEGNAGELLFEKDLLISIFK